MTKYNGHIGSKTDNRSGKKREEKIFKISYKTRERLEDYMTKDSQKFTEMIKKGIPEKDYKFLHEQNKVKYSNIELDILLNELLDNLEIKVE